MEYGKKQITLFKAISLSLIVASLLTLLMHWMRATFEGISIGTTIFGTSFSKIARIAGGDPFTSFWSVMLLINGILLILLAGLAVYGLLKDKNSLVLPFTAVGFISFFLAVFQKAFIGESELHVGLGAWLMLFLSMLAFAAVALDSMAAGKKILNLEDIAVRLVRPGFNPGAGAGGWICPGCGARQGASKAFCDNCGSKKPEPPRCPACGKVLKIGERFCDSCGARVN